MNVDSVSIPRWSEKKPLLIHNIEAENPNEVLDYLFKLALVRQRCSENNSQPDEIIIKKVY